MALFLLPFSFTLRYTQLHSSICLSHSLIALHSYTFIPHSFTQSFSDSPLHTDPINNSHIFTHMTSFNSLYARSKKKIYTPWREYTFIYSLSNLITTSPTKPSVLHRKTHSEKSYISSKCYYLTIRTCTTLVYVYWNTSYHTQTPIHHPLSPLDMPCMPHNIHTSYLYSQIFIAYMKSEYNMSHTEFWNITYICTLTPHAHIEVFSQPSQLLYTSHTWSQFSNAWNLLS